MKKNIKSTEELAMDIAKAMVAKKDFNDENNSGVSTISSYPTPNDRDLEFFLNKDEMRKETGRTIIRNSFVDDLAIELKKQSLEVENNNGTLKIKLCAETEYKYHSLSDMKKNKE